jgi:hypothetical protein
MGNFNKIIEWRGAVAPMDYQLVLSDVLVSQSVVRRKLARFESNRRCVVRDNRLAKLIQTKWRGTVALMSYQLYLMMVVVIQTFACSRLATRLVNSKRNKLHYVSARKIQSTWRGYDALSFYRQYISSRKIQAICRGYIVLNSGATAHFVCDGTTRPTTSTISTICGLVGSGATATTTKVVVLSCLARRQQEQQIPVLSSGIVAQHFSSAGAQQYQYGLTRMQFMNGNEDEASESEWRQQ